MTAEELQSAEYNLIRMLQFEIRCTTMGQRWQRVSTDGWKIKEVELKLFDGLLRLSSRNITRLALTPNDLLVLRSISGFVDLDNLRGR